MDRIHSICHQTLCDKMSALKACPWTDSVDSENVENATRGVTKYLSVQMKNSHIAIMRYFVPFLVDQCLTDISCLDPPKSSDSANSAKTGKSGKAGKSEKSKKATNSKSANSKLDLQSKAVVERVFTALYLRYNALLNTLIQRSFVVLPHLLIILLQRRHSIKTQEITSSEMVEINALKCRLLVIWCSTLFMDQTLKSKWTRHLTKEQVAFCFENMLKFVLPFNDAMSREMARNIKKQAVKYRVVEDMPILKHYKALQKFVEPIKFTVRLDKDVEECVDERVSAEERCR